MANQFCPACGAPYQAGALFCGNCGTKARVNDGDVGSLGTPPKDEIAPQIQSDPHLKARDSAHTEIAKSSLNDIGEVVGIAGQELGRDKRSSVNSASDNGSSSSKRGALKPIHVIQVIVICIFGFFIVKAFNHYSGDQLSRENHRKIECLKKATNERESCLSSPALSGPYQNSEPLKRGEDLSSLAIECRNTQLLPSSDDRLRCQRSYETAFRSSFIQSTRETLLARAANEKPAERRVASQKLTDCYMGLIEGLSVEEIKEIVPNNELDKSRWEGCMKKTNWKYGWSVN